eukprot:370542-Rhodomonas_salina.2
MDHEGSTRTRSDAEVWRFMYPMAACRTVDQTWTHNATSIRNTVQTGQWIGCIACCELGYASLLRLTT